MKYGYERRVELGVDEAVEKVTAALAERGFGVLTTIDVQATLKKKLDVDRAPYMILGACNPNFAHQALQVEEALGLLLPCNVIVYEDPEQKTVIAAIDAGEMMSVVGNESLAPVADQVNPLLRAAIDAV